MKLATIATAMLLLVIGARLQGAERVGVIGSGGGDADKLALLIEISLQQHGIDVVERARLLALLDQKTVQEALTPGAVAARGRIGHELDAGFLVFVHCLDQPSPRLDVTICECTQGIRLSNLSVARTSDLEQDAAAAEAAVTNAVAKSKRPGLTLIAVAPWSSDDFSTHLDYQRAAFRRLVEGTLIHREDVVVVELAEARALATELAISRRAELSRKHPLFIAGRMKHTSMSPDADVTVSLELTGGPATIKPWTLGPRPVQKAADEIGGATNHLVDQALGLNLDAPSRLQSAELAARGKEMLKFSFFGDAYELFEAALLLDPMNVELHRDAVLALGDQIALELSQLPVVHSKPEALTDRLLTGLAHLEFFLTRTQTKYADYRSDVISASVFMHYAPQDEVREASCRIMRYKREHQIRDGSGYFCFDMADISSRSGYDLSLTTAAYADYIGRLADVWITGSSNGGVDHLFYIERLGRLNKDSPEMKGLLAHLRSSSNPEAVKGAAAISAVLENRESILGPSPTDAKSSWHPDLSVDEADIKLRSFLMPLKYNHDFSGWLAAGLHADVFYTAQTIIAQRAGTINFDAYYWQDDGLSCSLGSMADGSGPVFDGRYVWFAGNAENAATLYAFDTEKHLLMRARLSEGVPPDPFNQVFLVETGKGQVCIAASVGDEGRRSWIGTAKLSTVTSISCEVLREFRAHAPRWDADAPIDCAFVPTAMCALPGPPGAGDKATPHVYINRGGWKMIMLNLQARTCSLAAETPPMPPSRATLPHHAVKDGKLYCGLSVWDPCSGTISELKIPETKDLNRARFSAQSSAVFQNGIYYTGDEEYLFAGLPEQALARLKWPKQFLGSRKLYATSLLGLLDNGYQIQINQLIAGAVPAPPPDAGAWIRRYFDLLHDAMNLKSVAIFQRARGDVPGWLATEDLYLKYADQTPDRVGADLEVADYFMSTGDYVRAKSYADDAAKGGSERAIQCTGFVDEGREAWEQGETICRKIADVRGDRIGWFLWCCRTQHGDRKAAQVQALAAATDAEQRKDADGLLLAANYYEAADENAKAISLFLRAARDYHSATGALHAAVLAAAISDDAVVDQALACMPDKANVSGSVIEKLGVMWRETRRSGAAINSAELDRLSAGALDQNQSPTYSYLAGEMLVLQGQRDCGIDFLRRAAGMNAESPDRAFAAQSLRSLGIQPPKPGMIN